MYADVEGQSTSGGSHAGNGFGLHLVNVSNHLTTGGLTTAEVSPLLSTASTASTASSPRSPSTSYTTSTLFTPCTVSSTRGEHS